MIGRAWRWLRSHVALVAVGVSLLIAAVSLAYAHHQRGQVREAELALDSVEAAADTTRQVYAGYLEWVGGRAMTFQRRAIQAEMEATDREEEAGVDPRARTRFEIDLPGIEETDILGGGPVEEEGAVRVATLHHREAPVTVDVTARVPPPPDTATWDVSVALDALHGELTFGCGEAPEGRSIRPATANLTIREGIRVELSEVRTEPGVCNPVSRGWLFGWDPPTWIELGVPLAVGFELGRRF